MSSSGPAQRNLEVDVSDLRFEQAFIEHGWDERNRDIRWQTWQAAILAERERCAKIFAEVLEWLPPASAMDGKHKAAFREFVGIIEHEADAIRRGDGR